MVTWTSNRDGRGGKKSWSNWRVVSWHHEKLVRITGVRILTQHFPNINKARKYGYYMCSAHLQSTSGFLFNYLPVNQAINQTIYQLPINPSTYLPTNQSIYLPTYLSIYLSIYLSRIYLCQSACLYLSIHSFIHVHTGCFTTLGHNCRRWFPRSLWSKKFI